MSIAHNPQLSFAHIGLEVPLERKFNNGTSAPDDSIFRHDSGIKTGAWQRPNGGTAQ
jgi:hypothetical protein